jgi:hypothetical protein
MLAANLLLRFVIELSALAAFSYWGFRARDGAASYVYGIGAPLLMAVFWGLFVAPRSAFPLIEPVKGALALLVFGAAALALWVTGRQTLALLFAAVAVLNAAVLYVLET